MAVETKIRLCVPEIGEDEVRAVAEVLRSGQLIQKELVAEFERAIATEAGRRHAVAVTSGTAALHLAMLALDLEEGDIVVVPTYSWIATASVVELCGARPVFVDIDPRTFNMDVEVLAATLERLSGDPETAGRVKAVVPVHTFGLMADMPRIVELAEAAGLTVIEDAACALGAAVGDRPAGSWSGMGCFSFHPRKAITTGEGGAVVTDDEALADRLRRLRNHGQDPTASFDFLEPGLNYRMTEFQAALGLTQYGKFDSLLARRRELAASYDELLAGTPIHPPHVPDDRRPVYQSYIATLPGAPTPAASEVIQRLREDGVEASIGTCHMPMASFFREKYGFRSGDFPATDRVAATAIALPFHHHLSRAEQKQTVELLLRHARL